MDCFFGEANFVTHPGGALSYIATVYYETAPGVFNSESRIDVPVAANDTGATIIAKLLAAADTEATRLGFVTPTRIFGTAITKFR